MEPQNIIDCENHQNGIGQDLEIIGELMCDDFCYLDYSDDLDNIDIYNLSND